MRDRLVELIQEAKKHTKNANCNIERNMIFAEYLLANGVVALPCKVGDRVWAIRKYKGISHPQESVVSDMYFTRNMELMIVVKYVARGIWGKTVFRTKEEAERALKGGGE